MVSTQWELEDSAWELDDSNRPEIQGNSLASEPWPESDSMATGQVMQFRSVVKVSGIAG